MSENSQVPNPNSIFVIPSSEDIASEAIKDAIEGDIENIYASISVAENQPRVVERSANPNYIGSILGIGRSIEEARKERLEAA